MNLSGTTLKVEMFILKGLESTIESNKGKKLL